MSESVSTYGPWSGQVISAVKEGCRAALLEGPRRLVEAVFACDVQTSSEQLGKVRLRAPAAHAAHAAHAADSCLVPRRVLVLLERR